MKRQHKHAEMIRQWLDDDSLELEGKNGLGNWVTVYNDEVNWHSDNEYRLKPKMIKCGDMEFPEPMRVAPADGDNYWNVQIGELNALIDKWTWYGDEQDMRTLKRGIVHVTKEAAEAHAKALIALTEVKE